MKTPYPYQELQIKQSSIALRDGISPVLVQTPTGGGKTVMFANIAHRFIQKSTEDVIIFVHRRELAKQTRSTIFEWFGYSAQLIEAGMRHVPKSRIYIAMIESAGKRLPSNIGLAIIDECHIGSLHKAHTFFERNIKIIGFSATPISANKKIPLNSIYKKLIPGPQISELIKINKLTQNITIAPSDIVSREELKVKGSDFDNKIMGEKFSKAKHVKNTIKYYEKFLLGKKTLIFNCNIQHSIEVTKAFIAAGYNCRHLDSENCTDTERERTLEWLKHTPNAILSSVGILTTGFDEPSIEGIIVNRSIMSLSLWLQITGRGGRTFDGKEFFYIIDMGANAVNLGDWSDDRDWIDIFENPPQPRKNAGVAPCKSCPQCEAIIAAQAMECKWCGYKFPVKEVAEESSVSEEYRILTKGVDIEKLMQRSQKLGHKQYASFYKIGERIIKNAPNKDREKIINVFQSEAKKWCELNDKKWNLFHKKLVTDFVDAELSKLQAPQHIAQAPQIKPNQTIQPITNLTPITPTWL